MTLQPCNSTVLDHIHQGILGKDLALCNDFRVSECVFPKTCHTNLSLLTMPSKFWALLHAFPRGHFFQDVHLQLWEVLHGALVCPLGCDAHARRWPAPFSADVS